MLGRSITVADRLILRKVVRRLPGPLGPPVTWIGRAATGGGLWFATAAVLSGLGRRGRRGAASGLVAWVVTNSLANGPAKWLVGRPRPGGAALVGLRRIGRRPGTSSFPSSHSAAAMAFAVAATSELPAAGPVLLPVAAVVALSRVHAVRHHPSDVVAGMLLGASTGAATAYAARRWRDRRDGASDRP